VNQKEYLALAESELLGVLEILRKKNADYSGGSEDALANFKLCQTAGLAEAETGILIRMMDKIQRVKSFVSKGSLQVEDETAKDAARDLIGYSICLLALLEDRQTEKHSAIITVPSGAKLDAEVMNRLPGFKASYGG